MSIFCVGFEDLLVFLVVCPLQILENLSIRLSTKSIALISTKKKKQKNFFKIKACGLLYSSMLTFVQLSLVLTFCREKIATFYDKPHPLRKECRILLLM